MWSLTWVVRFEPCDYLGVTTDSGKTGNVGREHSIDEVEVEYCLNFDATVHTTDEAGRQQDRRFYGVTYRVLGES